MAMCVMACGGKAPPAAAGAEPLPQAEDTPAPVVAVAVAWVATDQLAPSRPMTGSGGQWARVWAEGGELDADAPMPIQMGAVGFGLGGAAAEAETGSWAVACVVERTDVDSIPSVVRQVGGRQVAVFPRWSIVPGTLRVVPSEAEANALLGAGPGCP